MMQSYAARYSSFTPTARLKASKAALDFRWPHPNTYLATPTTLATAGFYFNPSAATPDAVSCFICDKGLADWDPEDDPAQIHAQKCPKCPWAILRCVSDRDGDGRAKFTSPARLPSSRAMEKARLATFGPDAKKWWPHDAKGKSPTSKTMAKSGFVYTPAHPKDDTCICIYCGIELSGWQPEDDPMEEHRSRQARNGPCPFFTHRSSSSSSKHHVHPKSRPSSPAIPEPDDDAEYQLPGTRSSMRAPAASTSTKKPGSSTKSSRSKSSAKPKKVAKAKTIEEEVVEEYHVALDDDEDAPPKPRPKPRRGSSRSRSRASTATESDRASSVSKAPSSAESYVSTSSSKKTKPRPQSASSSKRHPGHRSDSEDAQRSTRSRLRPDDDMEVEEPEVKPLRGRKAKGKSKAVEEIPQVDLEPKLVSEPSRGRSEGKPNAVEGTDEECEMPRIKKKGRSKAVPKEIEKLQEMAESRFLPKESEDAEEEASPQSRVEPKPGRSKASKWKAKAAPEESEVPEPGPELKTIAQSKANGRVPVPTQRTDGVSGEPEVDAPHFKPAKSKSVPAPTLASQHSGNRQAATPRPQFKLFRSAEDEELAREEEALEEQARELMLADSTLTLPLNEGNGQPVEMLPLGGEAPETEKGKGRAKMWPRDDAMDIEAPALDGRKPVSPPPSTPPRSQNATKAPPAFTKFPQLLPNDTLLSLSDVEREMTVEQWVRHEMDRQYEQLRSDGRQKIDAFKVRAAEVASQIEGL